MPNIFQQISRGIEIGKRKSSARRGKDRVLPPRSRIVKPLPASGGSNVESFDEPSQRRLLTGIPNPNAKKPKRTRKK